jgi:hypothetical protein
MEGLLSLQYRWQLIMTQCSRAIIRRLGVLFSAQFAVIFKDLFFLTVTLRRLGANELLGPNMSPSRSFKLGYRIA